QPQTPAEPGPPTVAHVKLLIRDAGWKGQLRLSARTGLAPDFQAPAHPLGALVHAWQTEVPGTRAFHQDARIDPLAVIANPQPEHTRVVPDFCLDPACVRVPEGIAQNFAADPINLIPEEWSERQPRSLHDHAECGRTPVCLR